MGQDRQGRSTEHSCIPTAWGLQHWWGYLGVTAGSRGRVGRDSTQLYAESSLEEPLFPAVLLMCLMACTSLGKEGCGRRAACAPLLSMWHQQTGGLLKHGGVCLDSSAGKSLLFSVLLAPSLPPSQGSGAVCPSRHPIGQARGRAFKRWHREN